ncbi:MAG TPA: hydantoinase/carbamoylase family amidase [Kiloniellales bacterium]|nr:hydantoinase/carbamoylase family amidase [Kiloniellales bacterium]
MTAIAIDPARLLGDLQHLRSFGASSTGAVRPAFTPADIAARRWLADRMSVAGLVPRFDPVGNLFGLPPGAKPILIGSHSDTQPEGGWLDGAYGVIAGLEIARASLAAGGPPVACVAFQEEEGRFGPWMGSHFVAGHASLAEMDAMQDLQGVSFAEARRAMPELAGAERLDLARFAAFLELHIEQGPVLDRHGERIGVVEAIVGLRQFLITIEGEQNHAGTTPMALRRDAFDGLRRFANLVEINFMPLVQPSTVWTIGHVAVHPSAPSVVPGRVTFTLQFRDSDPERLVQMEEAVQSIVRKFDTAFRLTLGKRIAHEPERMDARLIDHLSGAAQALAPGKWRRMPSGALHDAMNLAPRLPTAMLFVPSLRGISHSFAEDTREEDLALGVQVLADAVGRIAKAW